MKKLLTIPDEVHKLLEDYKELTGRSVTGIIQEAIYRWLIHEKILIPKRVILYYDEKLDKYFTEEQMKEIKRGNKQKKINSIPEELKFCEGDKCQVVHLKGGGC